MTSDLDRLASLDTMRDFEPDPDRRARATAGLDRMFRTPTRVPAAPWRPVAWRLALGGVAAGVVGAGIMLFAPGDHSDRAYASWTAKPDTVTGADVLPQAEQCAAGWGPDWATPPTAADVLLAEQRGDATLILVEKDRTGLVGCISLGPGPAASGADLIDTTAPAPEPGRVRIETMGATEGPQGWYSSVIGRSAPDVTKVEIKLPDGTEVHASTRNGWWTAWWPGNEGGKADAVTITTHAGDGSHTYRPSDL
ncbi:hypothetical protein [Actinoplanes couchii]|uniref:Uncharacterized protein n=1 Tax=Actinoplanes couchii TaxID=403638 RepID=A0ABQ3WZJ0_9ACTN|nr:hypothetical protein [Actinoplanes couchii]MDR6316077.1 hypothetical protein [Actinoplanes couchii]GID51691.1 hypothetical protein Aco03nite_000950 [Actinoplanes couchii]